MKYWLGKEKETKIIVLTDESIILENPSESKLKLYSNSLANGKLPNGLFNIPFGYIKRIELKDISNKIDIFFGKDSREVIVVDDLKRREEIFEELKSLSPKLIYKKKEVGKIGAARKPIVALVVFSILFFISYNMAIMLENGELYGDQIAILLALASFGSQNLIKIFLAILLVLVVAIYLKMRNTYELHIIFREELLDN